MGEIRTFFFDTYALHELIEGNPNYRGLQRNVSIVITRLNLMELCYGFLRNYGQKIAEIYFDKFREYAVHVDDNTIKKAMIFRHRHKKKGLSYVDCIGYLVAKQRNIKFLTGDKEFEHLENVEYVK